MRASGTLFARIASLGAHGWTPLESSLGTRGSPPSHLVDVFWVALMYYAFCDCMLYSGDTCFGSTHKYVHRIGHDCETKSGLDSLAARRTSSMCPVPPLSPSPHRDCSVTLKRIGFFCFPIKHSTHTVTPHTAL